MQANPNQLPIIEIKPEDVIVEEVRAEGKNIDETRYPIEITHEHDEDVSSITPEYQVHVAVNENENITDTGPEMYSPIELTPFKMESEGNQQTEVKAEFELLKTKTNTWLTNINTWLKNTNTKVNTDYEQSNKAEIEEVNAEYNQAETDQSRPDRMSLVQTELNQHQEEVSQ